MNTFCRLLSISVLVYGMLCHTSCKKEDDNDKVTPDKPEVEKIMDIDGNQYAIVTIGTQTWMAENLRTATLKDGTAIPLVSNDSSWCHTNMPAYCYYDNNNIYKSDYGALYNWHTVNTNKLCPAGWHVPDEDDWTTLADYLGGQSLAGGKLKETGTTYWQSPNTCATNESGFSGRGGGYRSDNGGFLNQKTGGYWWSATQDATGHAWYRYLVFGNCILAKTHIIKMTGFSVRCIKDE